MKIVRFRKGKGIYFGIKEEDSIYFLKDKFPPAITPGKRKISLSKVKILVPVRPSKIILVGLNYKDHAKELGMKIPSEPVIFFKPPSSLIGPQGEIIYPKSVKKLDYEAELAVIIKKEAKNIPSSCAKDYILGYTCLNDITARDLQKKDGQWSRAKSFDTFCPLGPWIETDLNPKALDIKLYVNGKLRQSSNTRSLIFDVFKVVSFISKIMTLYPFDVISTGTPPGVGKFLKAGDKVEVEIEKIGRLINYVRRQ